MVVAHNLWGNHDETMQIRFRPSQTIEITPRPPIMTELEPSPDLRRQGWAPHGQLRI